MYVISTPQLMRSFSPKALDFAHNFRPISKHERDIIHEKRSLLFSGDHPWEKKIDVTMGSFDGAETCELVGCYLLSLPKNMTKKSGYTVMTDWQLSKKRIQTVNFNCFLSVNSLNSLSPEIQNASSISLFNFKLKSFFLGICTL